MLENYIYLYEAAIIKDKLGFGNRLVFGFSGCNLDYPECIAEDFNKLNQGFKISVEDFINTFFHNFNLDGITFSGGESLLQKYVLLEILKRLDKNIHKMLFTGYDINELDEYQK